MQKLIEDIPYPFRPEELVELARKMGAASMKAAELEQQKSSGLAELNASIKTQETIIRELGTKIACGYELRPTECIAIYNSPSAGRKTIVTVLGSVHVREDAMTDEERQQELQFGEES